MSEHGSESSTRRLREAPVGRGEGVALSACPEVGFADSAGGLSLAPGVMRDADRRVVAIAPDAMELLRPSSDLARLLECFGRADVLLAEEDVPMATDEDDPDDWTRDGDVPDEVRTGAAALRHPDLVVHRLGLGHPVGVEAEGELVAAMSELVGFDPEHDVYCLAPASSTGNAITRAAERIAQVYGLPLLRYRCLELSIVDGMGEAG